MAKWIRKPGPAGDFGKASGLMAPEEPASATPGESGDMGDLATRGKGLLADERAAKGKTREMRIKSRYGRGR